MIHMSQLKISIGDMLAVIPKDKFREGRISEEEIQFVKKEAANKLRLKLSEINDFTLCRRSIDARRGKIFLVYQAEFSCGQEKKIIKRYGKNDAAVKDKSVDGVYGCDKPENEANLILGMKSSSANFLRKDRPVVVGMGPAGLFAALYLAYAGLSPIVIERGSSVDIRRKKVETFWGEGALDTECNVQFGEGGAGTFSDGKLNTMVKDREGLSAMVLKVFVYFGAPAEILYLQKPHIGTDLLCGIVCEMRKKIVALGGEVLFDTKLMKIHHDGGKIKKITVLHEGVQNTYDCSRLILAIGHSARDTVKALNDDSIIMEPKPFAVGVRVEHPQSMIGDNQYGEWYKSLPAADYKLTYQTKSGRGVYSFCMCPGGFVVNSSSENGRLAVNGMSNHARDGKNANSAIVVTVGRKDFGSGVFSGMDFQQKWEEAAYKQGNGRIPVQLFGDFVRDRASTALGQIVPQMKGGYSLANVRSVLPDFVGDAIHEGMLAFGKKIPGFDREDVIMSGIESRTSSPIRIPRNENFECNIKGVYPCGEGAGYAGGIMSAAMDGLRVAKHLMDSE